MSIEIRQLRYLCMVADEGNLTRAAARLRLSAPSVSQQIRQIERDLGCELFERTRTGMTLTPAGAALLPEARAVLAGVDRMRELARTARPRFTVGITVSTPVTLVRRLSEAARRAGAGLDFTTAEVPGHVRELRGRGIDLGLLVLPLAEETGELSSQVVHREPVGALMSPGNPLAGRSELRLADLDGQRLLWFRRTAAPGYHDDLLGHFQRRGWRPELRVADLHLAVVGAELAADEELVTVRPASTAPRAPGLVWRPLVDVPPMAIALFWHAERRESQLLETVAAAIRLPVSLACAS
uniref:Putative LysR transcriptional regulator n=1 Tax=Streptoalloteichus sp. ATCC 53650 TaxID=756733 RepID=K4PC02_9PSEU|nr:putative LysR transcriptional regulator [Streptoalloteichus sp. ATCC 53650]